MAGRPRSPDNFEMICEYPRSMTVYVLGTMSNKVGLDHVIRGYRGTMTFTDKGWVARNKDGKILEQYAEKKPHEDMHNHHTNLHNHLGPASRSTAGSIWAWRPWWRSTWPMSRGGRVR